MPRVLSGLRQEEAMELKLIQPSWLRYTIGVLLVAIAVVAVVVEFWYLFVRA
jgi:hypothetical protein